MQVNGAFVNCHGLSLLVSARRQMKWPNCRSALDPLLPIDLARLAPKGRLACRPLGLKQQVVRLDVVWKQFVVGR